MSGPPVKRVRFSETRIEVELPERPNRTELGNAGSSLENRRDRHSLDSDEEEGEESTADVERLTDDNIEGQEEATITNDNGIAITPFNLREEMQEGYFDSTGCYVFNKEKEIRDNWLDNVDWDSVKRRQQRQHSSSGSASATAGTSAAAEPTEGKESSDESEEENGGGHESDSSGEDMGPAELARICSGARNLLDPGETVAAAIKRLGGGANRALTASQRLRLRKAGGAAAATAAAQAATAGDAAENRRRMLELSELAGKLVSAGHMAAYQMDAEQLGRLGGLRMTDGMTAAKDEAAGMDMFASDDEAESKDAGNNKEQEGSQDDKESSGVYWFYRVSEDPSVEILGPFSSQRMLEWSESDTGWPGGHRMVFVRKADAVDGASFYSSARIDFDLYV